MAIIYSRALRILNGVDGRYPTREEEEIVLTYASSLPKRLQAASQVYQRETECVSETVEEMKRRYPRFAPLHDRGWEKALRDMQLCLRYAVQAMVADDEEMPVEKLYVWLGTIVKGFGLTTQFSRDAYTILRDRLRQKLPAESFSLMEPHLNRLIKEMSTYIEPSRPAVG